MILVVIVFVVEYVGDMLVILNVINKDYLKKLGLYCIIVGDGVVIMVVIMFGVLFNIIYSEVIGVVMLICVFNLVIMIWVVIMVIVFVLVGKFGVLL